ncbi:MAG: M23 family metallopeptidase [Nitrospirae bacterium]|nr:MAG: M23 family metallopeptidase [Nitrospirota bacterium]
MPEELQTGGSRFLSDLIRENRLDEQGFKEWVFEPGMLFGARDKWWGDRAQRDRPHEGVDVCLYRNIAGDVIALPCGSLVPVLYDGEVVSIIADFLGRTIFVRHQQYGRDGQDLYTVYGHVNPSAGLCKGMLIRAGAVIADIPAKSSKRSGLLPHLHISVALISSTCDADTLGWEIMRDPAFVRLLDPLLTVAEHYDKRYL